MEFKDRENNEDLNDSKDLKDSYSDLPDFGAKESPLAPASTLSDKQNEKNGQPLEEKLADGRGADAPPLRSLPSNDLPADTEASQHSNDNEDERPFSIFGEKSVSEHQEGKNFDKKADPSKDEYNDEFDDDNLDLSGLGPADFVEQDEKASPKSRKSNSKVILLGLAVLLAIIGLVIYVQRDQLSDGSSLLIPNQQSTSDEQNSSETGDTLESELDVDRFDNLPDVESPALADKASDAADFFPTAETEAAALRPLPAKPQTQAQLINGEKGANAADNKAAQAAATDAAKPAESKPAESNTAEKAQPATAKPAESKAAEKAQPAAAKPTESKAPEKSGIDGDKSGQNVSPPAAQASADKTPPLISDLWVVNISSTPDASESLRLLNRVTPEDVGGQVYFYETTIDDKIQHRIRVGFFNSREEAEEVGRYIKERFKLVATPWAVRPTEAEVKNYKR